jgi:hypothetical protein
MAKKPLLTKEKIKTKYPNQWLLLEDYELDASTTLRKGRVIAHSKDRDEIHRALKKHTGNAISASISPALFLPIPGSFSNAPGGF